jgi:hypothetical protein
MPRLFVYVFSAAAPIRSMTSAADRISRQNEETQRVIDTSDLLGEQKQTGP